MPSGREGRTRGRARVDELPPEARERIDEMIAAGSPINYGDIASAVADAGYAITKGAIGRREAKRRDDERVRSLERQWDALNRFMAEHPGFNPAGAALTMLIAKLCARLEEEPELIGGLSADKAVAGMISAARAAEQVMRRFDGEEKQREEARGEVISKLREALRKEPELLERIEALADAEE